MKTLALAALLGTLAFEDIQAIHVKQFVAINDDDMYADEDAEADAEGQEEAEGQE